MNNVISKIQNEVQDRESDAWKKLCAYIDRLAIQGGDEFSPREELGEELFNEIFTLPETIGKLKKVKKVWLYGSNLKRIPPEIGQMDSLEYFDPYTSYDLHWFPYEITNCKYLKDSRISTRALYGNYKNRMGFPGLNHNPVRYSGDKINCSVCKKEMNYDQTDQYWITLKIGTDIVPLLVNVCSDSCKDSLPTPPDNYVKFPHKGGPDLKQPPDENELWKIKMKEFEKEEKEGNKAVEKKAESQNELKIRKLKLIKLIKKLWEK